TRSWSSAAASASRCRRPCRAGGSRSQPGWPASDRPSPTPSRSGTARRASDRAFRSSNADPTFTGCSRVRGREHTRAAVGCADAHVDGALAVAGLGDAIDRKVKTYSQGMRQRLGIARSLLGRPELLVFDEPTNGLDPQEMRAVRELLRRVGEEGRTVLLSSHILSEIEQICSHAVVMDRGRLVATGTVAELVASGASAYVEVDDRTRARTVLEAMPGVER